MGVEHRDPARLALQRTDQPDEQRVLDAVGEVAGMEGVAVVQASGSDGGWPPV